MSIIPATGLSASDLSRLGNNLTPGSRNRSPRRRQRRRQRHFHRFIAAVNRSLACVGERIDDGFTAAGAPDTPAVAVAAVVPFC